MICFHQQLTNSKLLPFQCAYWAFCDIPRALVPSLESQQKNKVCPQSWLLCDLQISPSCAGIAGNAVIECHRTTWMHHTGWPKWASS